MSRSLDRLRNVCDLSVHSAVAVGLVRNGGLFDDPSYFAVVLSHGDRPDPRRSRRRPVLAAR